MKSNLDLWSVNDILKMFQCDMNRQTLLRAEKSGKIPAAIRLDKGLKARVWSVKDLPEIGKEFGFLKPPKSQIRIGVYTAKGGVLKTTLSYTLARVLALHGIKTLLVGLDSQCSLTALALNPLVNVSSLDKLPVYKNVGDLLFSYNQLKDVIQKTTLPTLDILPETDDLTLVNSWIASQAAANATSKKRGSIERYEYFTKILLPHLKEYQAVIFDNSPSWSHLIENSLFASDYVISPAACDPGCYQVLENNLNSITEFGEYARKEWKQVFLVPTLKDKSKLSGQIHGAYLASQAEIVTQSCIRRTVKGAEAFSSGASPIEFDATSELSEDYFSLIKEIWATVQEG
jgi:chromosome partitioning protein